MAVSKPLLHPPLTEVAFEINFARQFLVENRIAEYQQKVSEAYPYPGDEFLVRLPPAVALAKPPKPEPRVLTPVRSFVFKNAGGTREIRVSVVNVNLLVTDYKDFEEYKNALRAVLPPAIEIFGVHRVERIGLRYINKISVPRERGPAGYRDYVRSPIDFSLFLEERLINFLTEVHLKLGEDKRITIRGGLLPDQDEAAARTYLLDLDCYSEGAGIISKEDLPGILQEYHDAIEAEFKRAVTERYWNFMERGEPM